LLHGEDPARDVAEEFEHHLGMRVEDNLARGMSAEAARTEALHRLGDIDAFRTETRRIDEAVLRSRRLSEVVDDAIGEVRRAVRSLARTPAFTLTAFVTLALGLGATISIFALLYAVVLRPLPYDHADELVSIRHPVPGYKADARWYLSVAGYYHFRRNSKTLADIGVLFTNPVLVSGSGFAERASGSLATASLFRVLRFRPLVGRLIDENDERINAPQVVVLSHDFWRRQFGADHNIVGKKLDIGGA
jgi:hypothetical protein